MVRIFFCGYPIALVCVYLCKRRQKNQQIKKKFFSSLLHGHWRSKNRPRDANQENANVWIVKEKSKKWGYTQTNKKRAPHCHIKRPMGCQQKNAFAIFFLQQSQRAGVGSSVENQGSSCVVTTPTENMPMIRTLAEHELPCLTMTKEKTTFFFAGEQGEWVFYVCTSPLSLSAPCLFFVLESDTHNFFWFFSYRWYRQNPYEYGCIACTKRFLPVITSSKQKIYTQIQTFLLMKMLIFIFWAFCKE